MDIERYTQLRELSRRIMSELTRTVPREAYEEIGKALGIVHKNTASRKVSRLTKRVKSLAG